MNIHFDYPLQSLAKQTFTILSLYNLVQLINKPTHKCDHIIDLVVVRTDDDLNKVMIQTHLSQTIIVLNSNSTFLSLNLLPHTGMLGTLRTLAVNNLMLNLQTFQSYR